MIREGQGRPQARGAAGTPDEVAALALRAATEAFEAYRAALPDAERPEGGPDQLIPEGSGPPAHPMLVALADLACAAHAAARMVEVVDVAGSVGTRDQRLEAAEMAACAASAARMAVSPRSGLDQWVLRLEVAHFAARSAHLATHLLPRPNGAAPPAPHQGHHRPASIPPSRRLLLESLSAMLRRARDAAGGSHSDETAGRLIDAAAAARDAAAHLVAVYKTCTSPDPACRYARISMRAACNAGFAALEPLLGERTPVLR